MSDSQEDCKVERNKINRQGRQERQAIDPKKQLFPGFSWRSWRPWRFKSMTLQFAIGACSWVILP